MERRRSSEASTPSFAGVVQVYHRLHVVEEEEKGRKVEQEVERESQVEEKRSRGHDHVDGVNDSTLEPR